MDSTYSFPEALPYSVSSTTEVPGLAYEPHECLDVASSEKL